MPEANGQDATGPGDPPGGDPRDGRRYAEAILRTMRQPLIVLLGDVTVETANRAFYRTFEVEPGETEGRSLYELGNGQWDIPKLRELLERILPESGEVEDFKVEHEFERIGRRVMLLNAHRMESDGDAGRLLLAIEDITEREHTRWLLEGEKEYTEKIVDASRDALLILDWDLRVKTANETFYETFEVDPAETEGRLIWELGNGQWDIPELRELLENVLPENEAFNDYVVEHDFEDVGHRAMVLNARRVDHMKLILLAIEDETENRRSAAALSESEAKYRVLVESSAQAVWEADARGHVVEGSRSWCALTGQTREACLGYGWLDAVHPDDREHAEREWRERISAGNRVEAEFRLRDPEGGWRWTNLRAAPVRDAEGRAVKWVGMNFDITDRKEAEAERELLLGELNHRVRNLFSIIRALASRGGETVSADEYRRVFLGRLDSLVNAHALALESRFQRIDLARLARRTLEPYSGARPETVEIEGDPVELDSRHALSLNLVLHELATNAVKYGAFSIPEGRLRLTWRVTDEAGAPQVRLVWEEHGGPPVTPPERGGFGTDMIGQVFDYELGGKVELDFRPKGLRVEARFALS